MRIHLCVPPGYKWHGYGTGVAELLVSAVAHPDQTSTASPLLPYTQ